MRIHLGLVRAFVERHSLADMRHRLAGLITPVGEHSTERSEPAPFETAFRVYLFDSNHVTPNFQEDLRSTACDVSCPRRTAGGRDVPLVRSPAVRVLRAA